MSICGVCEACPSAPGTLGYLHVSNKTGHAHCIHTRVSCAVKRKSSIVIIKMCIHATARPAHAHAPTNAINMAPAKTAAHASILCQPFNVS